MWHGSMIHLSLFKRSEREFYVLDEMTVVRFHSTSTSGLFGDYNHPRRQNLYISVHATTNNEQWSLTNLLTVNNAFIRSLPSIRPTQSTNETRNPTPSNQSTNSSVMLVFSHFVAFCYVIAVFVALFR